MNVKHIMNALVNVGVMTQEQADKATLWAEDEKALENIAAAKVDGQADPTFFDSIEADINDRRNP